MCFALNITELGCGVSTEFSVKLFYKVSESERAFVRHEMKLLKDVAIIIDSKSDYVSAISIVRKK